MTLRRLAISLLVLVGGAASACAVDTGDEPPPSALTRQALEDLDQRATEALWHWYVDQGLSPCDPPPDPWHPFVKYGYCEVGGNARHEAIPGASFDE